jgi:hypothetical protein
MEPTIFLTLSRYFQAGGSPETVVELLSENYTGIAQVSWLGGSQDQVTGSSSHLYEMVMGFLLKVLA